MEALPAPIGYTDGMVEGTSDDDLPRADRADLELAVKLFFDGAELPGTLLNIGMSGAFVHIDQSPPEQTVLALGVEPPIGPPLLFHAKVVRVGEMLDSKLKPVTGCALEFISLTPETEGRLAYPRKQMAWKP
jgi:hypothetical protein